MHTRSQTDLVNVWRSATDRPNVLAVIPPDSDHGKILEELRANDDCEVVLVESFEDGVRLLRRGNIAVVVLEGMPVQSGAIELILEGLSKDRVPRFFILSAGAKTSDPRWIRIIDKRLDRKAFRKILLAAAKEFESRADHGGVTALELLEAAAGFPDEAWLRICNESGDFGDLCIRGSKAIYCEADRLTGDEAVASILSWRSCLFEFRALPEFLNKNMDRPLAEIRAIGAHKMASKSTQAPRSGALPVAPVTPPIGQNAVQTAQSVETEATVDLPPPVPFSTSPAVSAVEEPIALPDFAAVEEPLDEPNFDSLPSELEFDVEEPPEMCLLEAEVEDLQLPDFDFSEPAPSEDAPRIVAQSLFAAVAVIGDGELEHCLPPTEQAAFAPATLRDIYDRSRLYSLSHKLGNVNWVLVGAASVPIVVAGVPGTDRLVAARLRSPYFGELEEAELKSLLRNLPGSVRATSV